MPLILGYDGNNMTHHCNYCEEEFESMHEKKEHHRKHHSNKHGYGDIFNMHHDWGLDA